eukprot:GEMP01002550.1.p1 GENE.GEMP01002550.1~~GEMP01002550.1.p1  ORF type:complete len:441 (+),score=56.56 GEMP01002550.1:410-1732(+)
MDCAECFRGALGSVTSLVGPHHASQKVTKRARMFAQRDSPATPRQAMFLSRMKGPQRSFQDDYVQGQRIGAGSFGEVFEAIGKKKMLPDRTNSLCAVKMMSIKDQGRDVLARELHSLISLNHPHVLALYAWYETSTQLLVVTELCIGGTLADKPCPSPESVLIPIFHGIFSALAYSHARGIVHRDIKPANVLFTADGTVKLGDWGLSTHIGGKNATTCGGQGTIFYVAPEVVTPPFTTSFSSDIWSVGVIFFMHLHNYHPYMVMSQRSPGAYRRALRNGVVMQPLHPDLDDKLATLLLRCLNTKAEDRPSAAECWRSDALEPDTSPSTSSRAARIIRDYSRCRKEEPPFIAHNTCDDHRADFLHLANDAGVVVCEGDIMIEYSEFVLAMTDEFADIPARARFHFETPEGDCGASGHIELPGRTKSTRATSRSDEELCTVR